LVRFQLVAPKKRASRQVTRTCLGDNYFIDLANGGTIPAAGLNELPDSHIELLQDTCESLTNFGYNRRSISD
jgi:hypothetical protein